MSTNICVALFWWVVDGSTIGCFPTPLKFWRWREVLAVIGARCHEAIQFPLLDFVCSGNKELFVVVVNRTKIIWPSIGKLIVIYEFLDWSLVGSPFGFVSKHPRTERSLNVLICTFLPGMIQYAYNQCQTIIYIYTRICLQPLSKFGMWLL